MFPTFCEPELSCLPHPFYAAISPQLTTINTSALFLCVNHPPNTQTAISWLLLIRLTPSLHHSSSVRYLREFLRVVNGFGMAPTCCILDLFHCIVCQPSPKYTNCHISASIHVFDPISSPFLICMSLVSIYMRCKRLWFGSFFLHFGPSALLCVSIVPQIPKLPYLGFYSCI